MNAMNGEGMWKESVDNTSTYQGHSPIMNATNGEGMWKESVDNTSTYHPVLYLERW